MLSRSSALSLAWYFSASVLGQTANAPLDANRSLLVILPDYGSFKGTQVVTNLLETKILSRPVDAWLGVEYSTQPVGEHRFQPAAWPKAFDGTTLATEYGPACYQAVYGPTTLSEACLTLNVFRPSGLSLDQKLPILIYLHGGSFVFGSARSFDGATFVAKSTQPLMVVTAQYRLGALGNIPSKLMEEEGLLNLGLRDQRQMLEFMQKYASSFGGDNSRITLAGLSAGGHSVGFHLFHSYGEDAGRPMFNSAILASGSPTARGFPGINYPMYQRQFHDLMDYVKCPMSPNAAALQCLRSADASAIQFVSSAMYAASEHNITWPWQPVSPGPLLEKRGSASGEDGSFFKIPVLISSVTDEGSRYAPQDLQTNHDFVSFWRNLAPGLTDADINELQSLYPDPVAHHDISPYVPQRPTFVSPQFQRISAAYGDYAYICPAQDTALRLASAGAPVYKARFNTANGSPTYLGVPHASDEQYFIGGSATQYGEIADIYSGYFASFVVSGDPNAHAVAGAPWWDPYNATTKMQLVVSPEDGNESRMEEESEGVRTEQCAWWRDKGRLKRLHK
jgi:carboxylesterase type B